AAADSQVLRTGNAFLDQLLGDRGEIVVDALAMLFQAGAVPRGPELPSAANVGEHEDAAALQPRRARRAAVVGSVRDLESAVRAEQGGVGAVVFHAVAMDDEEGNLGAI